MGSERLRVSDKKTEGDHGGGLPEVGGKDAGAQPTNSAEKLRKGREDAVDRPRHRKHKEDRSPSEKLRKEQSGKSASTRLNLFGDSGNEEYTFASSSADDEPVKPLRKNKSKSPRSRNKRPVKPDESDSEMEI